MRPKILPGLHRLWRDAQTLQFGLDPRRAVVLTEITQATAGLISCLDGYRTVAEIITTGGQLGINANDVEELIDALSIAGVVIDAAEPSGDQTAPRATPRHFRPDLAAIRLEHPTGHRDLLASRARRRIEIHAAGRLGPIMAALLAASGVGHLHLVGRGQAEAADACLGGILPTDEHRPYVSATADAIRRAAPEARVHARRAHGPLDAVVLAGAYAHRPPPSSPRGERCPAILPVLVRESLAVVGPLVIPGTTACLVCLDLHRRDNDPSWPVLAAQLASAQPSLEAGHVATVLAAASLAVMQLLYLFDNGEPEQPGVSLELDRLSSQLRRRSWLPHPDCPCRSQSRTCRDRSSAAPLPHRPLVGSQMPTEGDQHNE